MAGRARAPSARAAPGLAASTLLLVVLVMLSVVDARVLDYPDRGTGGARVLIISSPGSVALTIQLTTIGKELARRGHNVSAVVRRGGLSGQGGKGSGRERPHPSPCTRGPGLGLGGLGPPVWPLLTGDGRCGAYISSLSQAAETTLPWGQRVSANVSRPLAWAGVSGDLCTCGSGTTGTEKVPERRLPPGQPSQWGPLYVCCWAGWLLPGAQCAVGCVKRHVTCHAGSLDPAPGVGTCTRDGVSLLKGAAYQGAGGGGGQGAVLLHAVSLLAVHLAAGPRLSPAARTMSRCLLLQVVALACACRCGVTVARW